MCTTAAKKLDSGWFLIKTRDPVSYMRWDDEIHLFNDSSDSLKKLIVQNPNPKEDGYYGGINELGVSFVSTFVHVADNQISYIRKPYIRLILEAKTAQEAVKIIKSFLPRIGGNMFVADVKECYGIEGAPGEYFVEKIVAPAVKTNHFTHLPLVNLGFKKVSEFEAWSKMHQARAIELISTAKNVKDLKNILRDRKNADKNQAICTTSSEEKCFTHSAFIFDTKGKKAYYCQGNPSENEFKEFNFA